MEGILKHTIACAALACTLRNRNASLTNRRQVNGKSSLNQGFQIYSNV